MLGRFFKKLNDVSDYRKTVAELERLTDRDLADIGIKRADIYRIATETAIMKKAKKVA